MRFACFTTLLLAVALIPAWAYDNGPINGTTDAWTINFGYIVSDSFTIDGDHPVEGFSFGVWEFPGDVVTSVDWSITSSENSGTVFASGTAGGGYISDKYISTNQYGYNIDAITVVVQLLNLSNGTYWLNLQNASVASGDPVYWDENSGQGCKSNGCPSSASESALGTIPSEAFTVLIEGTVPEPSSIMLFASGMLGVVGVLRRRVL